MVGGTGGRGVVLSASYEARAFGVRSAMPVGRAQRLCPQAVFVPPRHRIYGAISKEVMAIFRPVTPEVEPLALDEAFLDVVRRAAAARAARRDRGAASAPQVWQQQGITCSVGVAPSKFVAKIASARCKPDGLLVVPQRWGARLPAPAAGSRAVGSGRAGRGGRSPGSGCGRWVTSRTRRWTPCSVSSGAAHGAHLAALAWGRDERRVTPRTPDKSIGAEETFARDIEDPDVIRRELLRLSGRTAQGAARRPAAWPGRSRSSSGWPASRRMTRSRTLP